MVKKAYFISILLSYFIASNAQQRHYKTQDFDVVIFSDTILVRDPIRNSDSNLTKRFTPTLSEIDTAEYALQKDWEGYSDKLLKYKRQYFGFMDNQGNKILLINAFLWKSNNGIDSDRMDRWLKVPYVIFDDDNETWVIEFNLKTRKIINYSSGTVYN